MDDSTAGGKYVPTATPKKKNEKVISLGNDYYSVHTNQIYRTVCHVPPGLPPTCAFKACIAQKELCERNNSDFFCAHIEEIQASKASVPENDLLVEECRSVTVISLLVIICLRGCHFSPKHRKCQNGFEVNNFDG